ncbi:MAG TPA: hypothetical protein VE378_03075 [Nitrososphaeraceae archaeon]|nr:hypothetical protein [Nitrososphaeraceae archaeon]
METGILIILSAVAFSLVPIIGQSAFSQNVDNITAPVAPQGTSLETTGDNLTDSEPETEAGNITAPVAPQGTSLEMTGDNLTDSEPETEAGNIS